MRMLIFFRYYEAKLLLVIFLWHPRTAGAAGVYTKLIKPLVNTHEATIDRGIAEAKAKIADAFTRQIYK